MSRWVRRLRYVLNRRILERDLEREMASHRAMMSDPRRFGSTLRLREESADVWGWAWIDDLICDLRYAARLVRRSPAFAAAAIITIALGIGASTAIFSVAYGVSLRPLPYPEPERLIRIYEANPTSGLLKQDVSEGAFSGWREGARSLESAALYSPAHTRFLVGSNQPVTVQSVSPAFFDVLGVKPMMGSGFRAEQEYRRGTDDAVLSHAAWQRLLGGRPDVIGASLDFRGATDSDRYVVVGVMPPAFGFGESVEIWRPNAMPSPVPLIVRNWRYDRVIARLRPDTTMEQARAELETVAARLARDFPASNRGWTVTVEPLHDAVIGTFSRATWLLLGAVAVVLLVTSVNVAGLLLARAITRERDTAVREALGAGRWRLLRLRFVEAFLLSALGTGLGFFIAWAGVTALRAAAPAGIPRLDAIVLDLPVLAVTTACALATALMIAATPLRASMSPRLARVRSVLVLAQCGGSVALVIVAAMLTRSFANLMSVDLGWDASGVLTLKVDPPSPPRDRTRYWWVDWSDRLIARLEATPGVERAAVTTNGTPLSSQAFPAVIARGRGKNANDDARWSGNVHNVTTATSS